MLFFFLKVKEKISLQLCKGIVENQIFEEFEEQKGISLFHHSSNASSTDDYLSIAFWQLVPLMQLTWQSHHED